MRTFIYFFRALAHTFPTCLAAVRIHCDIRRYRSFHFHYFCLANLAELSLTGLEQNKVTLGLFKVFLLEYAWAHTCRLRKHARKISIVINAKAIGNFFYGKVRMDKQSFSLQYQFISYI